MFIFFLNDRQAFSRAENVFVLFAPAFAPVFASVFVIGLLLLGGARPVAADEAAQFVTLDYDVRLNGILVASVEVDAELSSSAYSLNTRMRTRTLMDLILGFDSRAHAQGRLGGGIVTAGQHSDDNVWMGEPRRVHMVYGPDGPSEVEVSPSPSDEGRDEVSAELRRGTSDLLSTAVQISLWADKNKICTSTAKVFDGRRRYDLVFSPGDVADTAIGTDINCAGKVVRLAGRSAEPWLPRSHAPREFQLWLTRIAPDLPPVPSRMRGFSGIGWVVAELASHTREPRPHPIFEDETASE